MPNHKHLLSVQKGMDHNLRERKPASKPPQNILSLLEMLLTFWKQVNDRPK